VFRKSPFPILTDGQYALHSFLHSVGLHRVLSMTPIIFGVAQASVGVWLGSMIDLDASHTFNGQCFSLAKNDK
jgi:hypothetical protein